jgi:hypothetical protein
MVSATTGFTNAYVPTLAAVLFFKIYRYAVNPMHEPNTNRYPTAIHARIGAAAG